MVLFWVFHFKAQKFQHRKTVSLNSSRNLLDCNLDPKISTSNSSSFLSSRNSYFTASRRITFVFLVTRWKLFSCFFSHLFQQISQWSSALCTLSYVFVLLSTNVMSNTFWLNMSNCSSQRSPWHNCAREQTQNDKINSSLG